MCADSAGPKVCVCRALPTPRRPPRTRRHTRSRTQRHAEPYICTHSALECREREKCLVRHPCVCIYDVHRPALEIRAAAGKKVLVGAGACMYAAWRAAGELRWNEVGLHLSVADSRTLFMILAPVGIRRQPGFGHTRDGGPRHSTVRTQRASRARVRAVVRAAGAGRRGRGGAGAKGRGGKKGGSGPEVRSGEQRGSA